MNKALVIIDYQNDFLTGVLSTKEAIATIPNVINKIKEYQNNGDEIIFTQDTHYAEYLSTQEGRNLPVVHCIDNSDGWEIHDSIKDIINIKTCRVFKKLTFGSTDLAKCLTKLKFDEIEICGLVTDICVISNTLLIKAFLPETKITVDSSCCAGITPQSHIEALNTMKMCQINVI